MPAGPGRSQGYTKESALIRENALRKMRQRQKMKKMLKTKWPKKKCRNFSLWSTAINVYYTHKSPTMKPHGRKQRATLATQTQAKKQKNNKKKEKNIIKNKHYTDGQTMKRRRREKTEFICTLCEEMKQRRRRNV